MKLGLVKLPISALCRRNWMCTEMRVAINQVKVRQYADEMKEGATFPPPIVFIDPKSQLYHVGDGFHRIMAHKENGETEIQVHLDRGSRFDAILHNIEANREQRGLPFARCDKQRCIITLLESNESKDWSQSRIAETVGCKAPYVCYVVKKWEQENGVLRMGGIGKDGQWRTRQVERSADDTRRRMTEAVERRQHGESVNYIAKEMGVSRTTVTRYIQEGMKIDQLVRCPFCHGKGMVVESKIAQTKK